MKIIFICGSLEPGRDGVGDYILCLAKELNRLNIIVAVLALYDNYIIEEERTFDEILKVRLPSIWTNSRRFQRAKNWISDFNPDVISLQYVPYSFHKKGLPFNLVSNLKSIIGQSTFHIMFHELWLDSPKNIIQRLVSLGQKYIAYKCVSSLKPAVINVSIPYNKDRLASVGLEATEIKLFGNIKENYNGLIDFNRLNLDGPKILYFGTAPRDGFADQIIIGLIDWIKRTNSRFQFVLASGEGSNKNTFLSLLNSRLSEYDINVIDCGFLSVHKISSLMKTCTVGISRSQPHLLGKSGSAIAMLEHGMPIWLPKMRSEEKINFDFRSNLIFSDLDLAINYSKRPPHHSLLQEVANEFVAQFKYINR